MPPRDLLRLLVFAQVVRRELKKADDLNRGELLRDAEGMDAGDRLGVRLPGPDGQPAKIGTVRVDPAPTTAKVTDEDALLEWVAEHQPHNLTRTIRPAALKALLEQVKRYGGWPGPGGEVVPVAGVEVEAGDPKVVVSAERGAAEVIAAAYRRGELPELLQMLGELGPGEITP